MKRKWKLLILFGITFLLSGCTVEYNLDIRNATFQEDVIITADNSEESQQYYNIYKNWSIPSFYQNINFNSDTNTKVDGVEYYQLKADDRQSRLRLRYSFKQDNYAQSTMAKFCYHNFYKSENEDSKTVSYTASMNFQCFETYETLDKVVVKLDTNREMINHNADRVENDTYIWEITKDNARGKYIFFEIEKESRFGWLTVLKYILIGLGCLAILGLLFIIYFRRKWVKANRI